MQQENLAQIRLRISIICRHILSKHKQLRWQIKIHEIVERLSRKTLHLTPFVCFFFFLKKKKTKSTCIKGKKRQSIQACRVRVNLTLGRDVYLYQYRKAVARRALSVIPMKYLQKFLKTTRETI